MSKFREKVDIVFRSQAFMIGQAKQKIKLGTEIGTFGMCTIHK